MTPQSGNTHGLNAGGNNQRQMKVIIMKKVRRAKTEGKTEKQSQIQGGIFQIKTEKDCAIIQTMTAIVSTPQNLLSYNKVSWQENILSLLSDS